MSTEGNLRSKIDWANPIVGRKFTVFALFFFVFEGNFQVEAPGGGGLIFGGAYMKGLIFGILRLCAQFPKFSIATVNRPLLLEAL